MKKKSLAEPITKKSLMTNGELDTAKIRAYLLSDKSDIRKQVVTVLTKGLASMKPIVCDGEIFSEIDYPTRLKYAETIAEILGERKVSEKTDEVHFHFTNVLQQVLAYKEQQENIDSLDRGISLVDDRNQEIRPEPSDNSPAD